MRIMAIMLAEAAVLLLLLLFAGTGWDVRSLVRFGPPAEFVFRQTGLASWYGPGFHGRRTASGEPFDQNELTAAHRRLPLGAQVRVTNLENGRSVMVEINDRGPYVRGRIIDLSHAAARRLGIVEDGLAKVRIEATPQQLVMAAQQRAANRGG